MRKFVPIALLGLLALGAAGCTTTSDGYGKQKVVYHINTDDPKVLKAAMNNVQNHINAVGKENIDLRVVMHGDGLALLQKAKDDQDTKSKVDNLKLQGIAFNVCANTLKGKKLNYKSDLYDVSEKDIVPSGVAEIAHLQKLGFTYVKP
ncbi:MAG: DsrE family protein [Gammaproteobacteria bacterium]|nr:DsrE family protein [Gammaproteobacteria bacterium]